MKLFTSRFKNPGLADLPDNIALVGITLTPPRFPMPRQTFLLRALAPRWDMMQMQEEEYRGHYVRILEAKGVPGIRLLLLQKTGGLDAVLLCYEDLSKPGAWCHRRMFAQWWQEQTGEEVPELEKVGVQPTLMT